MTWAVTILWVWIRISAAMMAAPILGSRHWSMAWRLGFSGLLAAMVWPLVQPVSFQPTASTVIGGILSEALIGGVLGIGVLVILSAAEMSGSLIGQMAGLQIDLASFGEMAGQGTSARLYSWVSLVAFILIGGPELVLGSVLETFRTLPAGMAIDPQQILELLNALVHRSLDLALRAAGPAIISILLATVAIGMIARTVPQLNVLQTGLPSNLIVMLLALTLTLGGCVWLFIDDLPATLQGLIEGLRSSATPIME